MGHGIFIPDMVEEDEGGIAATNPNRFVLPLLVAPSPADKPDSFNTVRHSLLVVACKDIPDDHFEFDRSFVKPQAQKGFAKLPGMLKRHPNSPLGIWGHADPEGSLEYNQFLSERRAEAVFAVLTRDFVAWERLFSSVPARGKAIGDIWGDDAIAVMLVTVNPAFTFDPANKETLSTAIKKFEKAKGDVNPAGRNDAPFRRRLFEDYMNKICSDDKGVAFSLKRDAFLGDPDKRGPFQGCSEFNPQLILAKSESDDFAKDKKLGKERRHAANADNRRAMIFFFAEGTKIDQAQWACPRATEGLATCKSHLYSDHTQRTEKQFPNRRRRFGKQVRGETDRFSRPEMTFGCRFYQGLAQRSPCERDVQMYAIQLLIDAPKRTGVDGNARQVPVQNVRWVATIGEGVQAPVVRGRTTQQGLIGIPFVSAVTTITLQVDLVSAILGGVPLAVPEDPADPNAKTQADTDRFDDEETFITYTLKPDALFRILQKPNGTEESAALEPDADDPPVSDDERKQGARQRLFNLGFGTGLATAISDADFKKIVTQFQKNQKLANTDGTLDSPTIDELVTQYGS